MDMQEDRLYVKLRERGSHAGMDTRRYEGIYHLPEAVFGCASFSIFPHAPKIPADFSLADTVNDALFLWPRCPRDCGDAVCIVHPSSPIELVGSPSLAVVERSPPISSCEIGCDATLPYSCRCVETLSNIWLLSVGVRRQRSPGSCWR